MKHFKWIASLAMLLACTASTQAALFDLETKLTADDAATDDRFGFSVAISGNTALVGARGDDSDPGSAYLFDVTTGNQIAKLIADDAAANDRFGTSVAISGNTALIGARFDDDSGSNSGSAYLFDVTTGNQIAKLAADDAEAGAEFGSSVAISGNTALVGAWGDDDGGNFSGSAYLFDVNTGNQIAKLTADDAAASDGFGFSVAISGNMALVGQWGFSTGSAYLFDVTTGNQIAKLTPDAAGSSQFGHSVAISGNTALVGAYRDGGINTGSAYLFDVTTGSQIAKLTADDAAEDDYFGYSVAISGNTALVGAHLDDDGGGGSGSAYLFDVTTGNQIAKLTAADAETFDFFGFSVGFSGSTALVGAVADDLRTGSAYVGLEVVLTGDFDGDGEVDGGDFLAIQRTEPALISQWQTGYGNPEANSLASSQTVPEPSTLLLGVMACLGLLQRRNR